LPVFASDVERLKLDYQLLLGGKLLSSPSVMMLADSQVKVATQTPAGKTLSLQVMASDTSGAGVVLAHTLQHGDKITKPKIKINYGQQARVKVGELELTVIAQGLKANEPGRLKPATN
ncbi:MAG: hypothetical protein OIF38_02200, partial [Cellvibrionaceae bacterium]|nr:hypothetical protein [Cellvibrionaceae bacterium]